MEYALIHLHLTYQEHGYTIIKELHNKNNGHHKEF